jgi:hypothetical protein
MCVICLYIYISISVCMCVFEQLSTRHAHIAQNMNAQKIEISLAYSSIVAHDDLYLTYLNVRACRQF